MNHRRGFTLIELMVVIIFAMMILGLTSAFGISTLRVQELDRATETTRSVLALARGKAMSANGDDSWGVAFATSSLVEFRGASYASRNPAYDIETGFASRIVFSGSSEIVFQPPFGNPAASGTVQIFDGERSNAISINAYGMIETE